MPLKSSEETDAKKSRAISKPRAERFLLHLANLRGAWPLDENDETELRRTIEALDNFRPRYSDVLADSEPVGILILRDFLRKAWDATSARQRDWYIFKFRDYSQKMTDRVSRVSESSGTSPRSKLAPIPPVLAATFAEAAALTAQSEPSDLSALEMIGLDFLPKLIRRAKRCANPNCQVMPYFFAKKNSRKFCSETCSIPTQRAAKLRWWDDNRRSKRRKASAKPRRKA
jgi:hypothetical protein